MLQMTGGDSDNLGMILRYMYFSMKAGDAIPYLNHLTEMVLMRGFLNAFLLRGERGCP